MLLYEVLIDLKLGSFPSICYDSFDISDPIDEFIYDTFYYYDTLLSIKCFFFIRLLYSLIDIIDSPMFELPTPLFISLNLGSFLNYDSLDTNDPIDELIKLDCLEGGGLNDYF